MSETEKLFAVYGDGDFASAADVVGQVYSVPKNMLTFFHPPKSNKTRNDDAATATGEH